MENDEIEPVGTTPLWVGGFLTLLYLGAAFALLRCKLPELRDMDLNAVGDFSAGLFAPLAFLWLVVSLWMQRSEIKQNTDVLRHQLKELRSTVTHQEDIAWATTAELMREKPYIYIVESGLYYNRQQNLFEVDIHFNNSGGTIRNAKFVLNFPNYSDGFSVNEVPGESRNFRIDIPVQKNSDVDFNSTQDGVLTIDGVDVHREAFKHKTNIKLDFPSSKQLIVENRDEVLAPTLSLEIENIFNVSDVKEP